MTAPAHKPETGLALVQLLPNTLTIAAICAGLSAIRFGFQGNYVLAVQLIVAAAVLDGIDGRIARLLNSTSAMGAELDSLADFLNFGVAPPLIIFFWTLQDVHGFGWISVLVYAVCCAIRLARFNVSNKSDSGDHDSAYFEGVPAPAGALLVMLPMYLSFGFNNPPQLPGLVICLHVVLIGLLMISHIPTWSFKTTRISREKASFFLVAVAVAVAAVLTYAWASLIALCLGYIGIVVRAWIKMRFGHRH